jgi:serine/threonine protein kinase
MGKIDFSNELLMEISEEGRDFLSKVLVFDPSKRLDVKEALQHPWLRLSNQPTAGEQLGCIENLRQYHKRWKNWVSHQINKIIFIKNTYHLVRKRFVQKILSTPTITFMLHTSESNDLSSR